MSALKKAKRGRLVMGVSGVPRPDQKNFIRDVYSELIEEWGDSMRRGISLGLMPFFRGNPEFPIAFTLSRNAPLFTDWAWVSPVATLVGNALSSIPIVGGSITGVVSMTQEVLRFEKSFHAHFGLTGMTMGEQELLRRVDDACRHLNPYRSMVYLDCVERPVTIAFRDRQLSQLCGRWMKDFKSEPFFDEAGRVIPDEEVLSRLWNDFSSYRNEYRRAVWYCVFDLGYEPDPAILTQIVADRLQQMAMAVLRHWKSFEATTRAKILSGYSWYQTEPKGLDLLKMIEQEFKKNPNEFMKGVEGELQTMNGFLPQTAK